MVLTAKQKILSVKEHTEIQKSDSRYIQLLNVLQNGIMASFEENTFQQ